MPLSNQPVAKLAEADEPGPCRFRILAPRRQQHQAGQLDVAGCRAGTHDGLSFIRRGAELCRLSGEIHLHQDLERFAARGPAACRIVEALQQIDRVDRLDAREGQCRLLRLVGLQVADEMPPCRYIGRVGDLLQPLLDLVLAEIALPCSPRFADAVGAECLRDRDEGDVPRPDVRSAAPPRQCGHVWRRGCRGGTFRSRSEFRVQG